jgi:Plasmid recombination enzyme
MLAVLRFQKLKSREEIRAMFIHWRRDKDTPNADPDRKVEFLLGACTKDDVTWRLPAKFRSNAVLAMEGVLSASPRYFRREDPSKAGSFDPARTAEWVERSLTWLKSEFGDRLVSAVLHLDEATPHIHIAVVPLKRASCWLFAHLRLAGPGRERGMLCLMGRAVGYAGRATPAKTISR